MNQHSSSKEENSFLFSTSLVFNENIDKLWLVVKDLSTTAKIVDFLDNFKFIKGDNTWTPENVFSLYWVGVSNIEIKCISLNMTRMKKIIKWKMNCHIGISYYKTMILYRITNTDKTLVKIIITRCEKNKLVEFSSQKSYYNDLQYDILNYQSNYLQNLQKDKCLYQSCSIDKNHNKIWNFVSDFKKISNLCPDVIKNIEYKGAFNEEGTFIKFYHCESKKINFYKITKYITPIKTKTFIGRFEAVGTDLKNIPIIIELQVTMIEQNKTLFSVLLNFKNKSNKDIIDNFEINLKNVINKIIEHIKTNEKEFVSD